MRNLIFLLLILMMSYANEPIQTADARAKIELYKDGVLHSYFTLALDCGTI